MKKTILMVIGALALVFLYGSLDQTKAAPAGRSLTVVPPSFELYANPGDSVQEKIRVRNDSEVEGTYQVMVEDFKAVGEEGAVDLVDDSQSNNSFSLAKWVVPEPKSFTLAAGEEKEIPFSVNVPKEAEPGGHYASVLVKMGGDVQVKGGAAVSSRVGSLILLRVSGNVKEEANVVSFTTSKNFYEKGPIDINLRVKDTGNNHIRPKGTIVITNIFGQKVDEITLNGLNVLPGATRKMITEWKPKGGLANRYTATLVATYGQQNKSLSASTSFYAFPKSLGITALAGIFLIGLAMIKRKNIKKLIHSLTK